MAFISDEEINNIRAKADIVSIISSYIPLTQKGKNYFGVCPFHDDHSPSMSVSPERQIYTCFSCGATGNVFKFVEDYENVSFPEAISIVANKCGLDIKLSNYQNSNQKYQEEYEIMELSEKFYVNNLRTNYGKEALKYLHERGLDDNTIKDFGIGLSLDTSDSLYELLTKKKYSSKLLNDIGLINSYNDKNYDSFTRRITFPLWDKDGHIVGFSGRIYRNEKDTSKYINSRETKIFKKGETLYNYHQAKEEAKKEKSIIVVEGFMDAIRISTTGIKNVVALQGTAMTTDQIKLLKKLRCKIILCLDNDNAGFTATLNNGEELTKFGLETYVVRLTGQKDPDEYILANGQEAFKNNIENPITFFEFKLNALKQNKDLNKVEDLTIYINDVLKDIANNKDPVFRELYLNKISTEYEISPDILKEKLETFNPVEISKKEELKKVSRKTKYIISSEKILYFMMNDGEYIEEYQKKLGFFSDPLYREIANEILYYYEKEGQITLADFITYINEKERIKDKVMEIVNSSAIDELSMEAMDEYISVMSKVITQNEIKKLKEQMKKELDVDKKMKIAMQIAELKKEDV